MTQEQIDEMAKKWEEYEQRNADVIAAKVARGKAITEWSEMAQKCDHTNPDGSSAVEQGFHLGTCDICNAMV